MHASRNAKIESASTRRLSIGQCATLACLLEATAPKVGNVHRGADFVDLTFPDFVASAVAIAPHLDGAVETGVGTAALAAIRATRELAGTNTNLGTVLLLAPLAAIPVDQSLTQGIHKVLATLAPEDARQVYEAICLARPGGLGTVSRMDVAGTHPDDLLQAMREAAERDLVARQYVNGFGQVLGLAAPWLVEGRQSGWTLTDTIVHVHVRLMASFPDSLIARKCGGELAQLASSRATRVLEAGAPGEAPYVHALSELDSWLRSDHHRRNPGTTADLVAAGLFAVLREGLIAPPFR